MGIIKTGAYWLGKDWNEVIYLHLKTNDCYIEKEYKYKKGSSLLDLTKELKGYYLKSWDSDRYKTKIPTKYIKLLEDYLIKEGYDLNDNLFKSKPKIKTISL